MRTTKLVAAEAAATPAMPRRKWETRRILMGKWKKEPTREARVTGRVIP